MAYTPRLTRTSSCTLRRIAWAAGAPMTRALDEIIGRFVMTLDRKKVCAGCRDKRCCECRFSNGGNYEPGM